MSEDNKNGNKTAIVTYSFGFSDFFSSFKLHHTRFHHKV